MELTVQLLHICFVGFAEVAQDKRMFDDTADLARMKGPKPTLLSDYLFAHNLAFAKVR
ncbi:MAG: hypothetical protein QOE55_2412 [Acidobacteriaceae bacterium]|jgi:hypothetical protein|nr:hypothetical protein [Acidobacteriaceae bacterium]